MKKTKRHTGISFYLTTLLGGRGRMGVVRTLARMKYRAQSVDVHSKIGCAEKILIILPEEPFMALLQVETVVSIVTHFSQSEISLFCEQAVATYFKKIKGITSIITYEESERFLFSRDFGTYGKMLAREEFDVLFFLEREPHPAVLNIVVQSSIPLRISYEGVADFPFFNFRVRPSGQRAFIGDQNRYMLEALNIPVQQNIRWSVSRQSMEELDQLLADYKIGSDASVVLIDINYLCQLCGREWSKSFLEELEGTLPEEQICVYSSDTSNNGFVNWLRTLLVPVLSDLSSSRIAAIVNRSSVVVSGRALLYQIARFLNVSAVGIFAENTSTAMFQPSPTTRSVESAPKPDEHVAEKVIESIRELVG